VAAQPVAPQAYRTHLSNSSKKQSIFLKTLRASRGAALDASATDPPADASARVVEEEDLAFLGARPLLHTLIRHHQLDAAHYSRHKSTFILKASLSSGKPLCQGRGAVLLSVWIRGGRCRTRTCDLLCVKQTLLPAELIAHY
jgi:hypothetical protein